jgi:hypothetical protein
MASDPVLTELWFAYIVGLFVGIGWGWYGRGLQEANTRAKERS